MQINIIFVEQVCTKSLTGSTIGHFQLVMNKFSTMSACMVLKPELSKLISYSMNLVLGSILVYLWYDIVFHVHAF